MARRRRLSENAAFFTPRETLSRSTRSAVEKVTGERTDRRGTKRWQYRGDPRVILNEKLRKHVRAA